MAETIAAQDPAKAQWKQVTAQIDEIFARWQKHQADGPRLPKNEANELWKRFRAARATIDTHRKAFFAELDSVHKDARTAKQALVEKAQALVGKGADPAMLVVEGVGSKDLKNPAKPNADENRRVEIGRK